MTGGAKPARDPVDVIERMIERMGQDAHTLTKDEIDTWREIARLYKNQRPAINGLIKLYRSLEGLGYLGRGLKHILIWLGVAAGSWLVFKQSLIDWLASLK